MTFRLATGIVVGAFAASGISAYGEGPPRASAIELVSNREASLAFHLECMAGRVSCDRAGYVEFWRGKMGPQSLDALLVNWSAALEPISFIKPLEQPEDGSLRPELPDLGPQPQRIFDGRWRFQQLLFSNLRGPARATAIRAFLGEDRSRRAEQSIAEFGGFFNPWWANLGEETGGSSRRIEALLDNDLSDFLRGIRGQFGLAVSADERVVLVPRPHSSAPLRAFHKETLSVVELQNGAEPAFRAMVVVHELMHAYYAKSRLAQEANHAAVQNASGPGRGATYALMTEVLPTVLANGVAARIMLGDGDYAAYAARPLSFYASSDVDLAAKSAVPLVEAHLRRRGSFDEAFFAELHDAIEVALGDTLYTPRSALRVSTALFLDPSIERSIISTLQSIGANSFYTHQWDADREHSYLAAAFPKVTIAVVGTREALDQMISQSRVIGMRGTLDSSQELPCQRTTADGRIVFLFDMAALRDASAAMDSVHAECRLRTP